MIKYFDVNSIKNAKKTFGVAPSGFRYGFIANVFKDDVYSQLIKTFPDVKKFKFVDKQSGGGRKRFYTGPIYDANKHNGCVCHLSGLPEIWKNVLSESASPELVGLLKEQIGVDFNTMCTFGFAYGNEGCMQGAHIDGAVREESTGILSTIACLLYFNEKPDNTTGTCVYAPDRETVLFRAPSMRNGFFFFEQHHDAWHGFPLMGPGLERRLVSLAYSQEAKPLDIKNSIQHKLTCSLRYKAIAKKLLK